MRLSLDLQRIKQAASWSCWDVGNSVLYDLCRKYPKHVREDEIIAKVWLIGRSYSAAIERRRNSEDVGDPFYENVVAPKMRRAKIDDWLKSLSNYSEPTYENCSDIITAHKKLTELFREISGMEKRSLSSKYLHFHFPRLFFIYDSRAANAIPKVTDRIGKNLPVELGERDEVYAKFFLRCLSLVGRIKEKFDIELSPRQLDNYLLRGISTN